MTLSTPGLSASGGRISISLFSLIRCNVWSEYRIAARLAGPGAHAVARGQALIPLRRTPHGAIGRAALDQVLDRGKFSRIPAQRRRQPSMRDRVSRPRTDRHDLASFEFPPYVPTTPVLRASILRSSTGGLDKNDVARPVGPQNAFKSVLR